MTLAFSLQYRRVRARAFTLIELLVVMAVMIAMLALIVPAVAPILRSSSMNKSASMITDELNLARQLALAQNRDIEVRFYNIGSKTNPSDKQFRAFRSFYADGTDPAKATPIENVKSFPEPVILSPDPALSTLLDSGKLRTTGTSTGSESLPSVSGSTAYVGFMFRATGGTNLTPVDPPDGNWFLTLYLENAPKNAATGIPDNYFTAQVEPVTGRVRTYRP